MAKTLTVKERLAWLKKHVPKNFKPVNKMTWPQVVEKDIEGEMYNHIFNNPAYVGISGMSDDQMRHKLLDDLEVPKTDADPNY